MSGVLVALRVPASPERAFRAFTEEIDRWWQPNGLFAFRDAGPGRLRFEPGPAGRLVEAYPDGSVFEVGPIEVWEPPSRLVFAWRQARFAPDQRTTVEVRFEAVGDQTRITVEHRGWDAIPREHAARHGFPLLAFQQRLAEWWRRLLRGLAAEVEVP